MAIMIDTELISWLNKQTESSEHNVILVESFVFMLMKIKRQGYVRVMNDGEIHRRFWRALDRTYNYQLFHPKKKRQREVALFQFYYEVAIRAQFIKIENDKAVITEMGEKFLHLPKREQLAFLLNKIWE
ncbi:hypothetical protein ACJ2A9_10740 [Anaerobacillus sp. MEB173]|uniref:hypothetical protein n=1 Tax=Anaerobacillus sp. MEB173 TaxID=3383345 RepID=UPI003F8EC978